MKYRTVETSAHTQLRRERRSAIQDLEFPLEDLQGNIIREDRRSIEGRHAEGMDITETCISQAEFQEYFDDIENSV